MKPLNVLVAEDNTVNQRLALALLEKRGDGVTIVENGAAAVASWATGEFNLILMDIQMPEMDGLEATRIIRSREGAGERIPIIALTARAMTGDREACLAAGIDAYLSKPMRGSELSATIDRLTISADEPTRPAAGESPNVFDLEGLRANVGEDDALVAELITLFFNEASKHVGALRRATAKGDAKQAHEAAHALRGAASAITASRVATAVGLIEDDARRGNTSAAASAIVSLEAELDELEAQVRQHGYLSATPQRSTGAYDAVLGSILLIDDDECVRQVTARLLRREGYTVSDWASADEALAMLSSSDHWIDLLITDAVMPGTDGIEAAARVVALRPGTPVIFISGYPRETLFGTLPTVADHSFLAKPFHADQLTESVQRSLESRGAVTP